MNKQDLDSTRNNRGSTVVSGGICLIKKTVWVVMLVPDCVIGCHGRNHPFISSLPQEVQYAKTVIISLLPVASWVWVAVNWIVPESGWYNFLNITLLFVAASLTSVNYHVRAYCRNCYWPGQHKDSSCAYCASNCAFIMASMRQFNWGLLPCDPEQAYQLYAFVHQWSFPI